MRGFCFHILGEPGQNREPHFPSEQQVVGKLPGVHLSRGPEGDPGNRHGTDLEAPRTESENRLQTGGNTGLLDKQLSCSRAFQPWGRALRVLGVLTLPSQA